MGEIKSPENPGTIPRHFCVSVFFLPNLACSPQHFCEFSSAIEVQWFVNRGVTKGRFCKRTVLANVPVPLLGIQVHPPCACALFEGKITCGRCGFTRFADVPLPLKRVKPHLPKPPLLETTLVCHNKSSATHHSVTGCYAVALSVSMLRRCQAHGWRVPAHQYPGAPCLSQSKHAWHHCSQIIEWIKATVFRKKRFNIPLEPLGETQEKVSCAPVQPHFAPVQTLGCIGASQRLKRVLHHFLATLARLVGLLPVQAATITSLDSTVLKDSLAFFLWKDSSVLTRM